MNMTPPSSTDTPPPPSELPPPSTATAPPSTATATPSILVVSLVVRLLTLVFLVISLIIISTNTITYRYGIYGDYEIKFNYLYAYRYMLASSVFGITYTLLQTAFSIFQVSTGNRLGGDSNIAMFYLDFYGDKVISYLLGTGAAAGFGISVDLNRLPLDNTDISEFLDKAIAAASLLIVGFLLSAVSSVVSSLALPKRA